MEWLQRAQVDVSASLHGHTLIGLQLMRHTSTAQSHACLPSCSAATAVQGWTVLPKVGGSPYWFMGRDMG